MKQCTLFDGVYCFFVVPRGMAMAGDLILLEQLDRILKNGDGFSEILW